MEKERRRDTNLATRGRVDGRRIRDEQELLLFCTKQFAAASRHVSVSSKEKKKKKKIEVKSSGRMRGCVSARANLRDFVRACVQAWKHNGVYLYTVSIHQYTVTQ